MVRAFTPNQSKHGGSSSQSGSVPPSPAGSDFDEDLEPPQFVSSFMKDYVSTGSNAGQAQAQANLRKSPSVQSSMFDSAAGQGRMHRARHSEDNIASPTASSTSRPAGKVFGSSAWNRSKEALVGGLKRTNSASSSSNDLQQDTYVPARVASEPPDPKVSAPSLEQPQARVTMCRSPLLLLLQLFFFVFVLRLASSFETLYLMLTFVLVLVGPSISCSAKIIIRRERRWLVSFIRCRCRLSCQVYTGWFHSTGRRSQ